MATSCSAIVIGAGIAGVSVAFQLVQRGLRVTILESSGDIATQASGNSAGILSPYVLSQHDRSGEFLGAAFSFTRDLLHELSSDGCDTSFTASGIVQLPATRRITRMIQEGLAGTLQHPELTVLSAQQASDVSGVTLTCAALYYARGGWIAPRRLCAALLKHAGSRVTVRYKTRAQSLVRNDASWEVSLAGGEKISTDLVVVANAYECQQFEQTRWMPVEAVRGLIAHGPRDAATLKLRTVLCHSGYVVPFSAHEQVLGTTYRHGVFHRERDSEEERELVTSLAKWLPQASAAIVDVRVCFRTSTSDRLPYVGIVTTQNGETLPGLFVSVGHGSRGLVTAPFCASILAQIISAEAVSDVAPIVAVDRVRAR